jgi:hypothetical protein
LVGPSDVVDAVAASLLVVNATLVLVFAPWVVALNVSLVGSCVVVNAGLLEGVCVAVVVVVAVVIVAVVVVDDGALSESVEVVAAAVVVSVGEISTTDVVSAAVVAFS